MIKMDDDVTTTTDMNQTTESIENSIEFTIARLYSNDEKLIIETIIQIKNLIIGNNKYKSFYLKETLVDCLIGIVQRHYALKSVSSPPTVPNVSAEPSDLIYQILIIFASFSLGNLEHIIRLIKYHRLHELLFTMLRLCSTVVVSTNCNNLDSKLNTRIIEAILRCLSNLYSSSQLVASLVYLMDKQLYSSIDTTLSSTVLDTLLRFYPLTSMTKHSVITIVSISSQAISIALTSSNRYLISSSSNRKTSLSKTESSSSTDQQSSKITTTNTATNTATNTTDASNNTSDSFKQSRYLMCLTKVDEQLRLHRTLLLKSECISKFAHLLTSLLEPVQLQTLKFYSSICFENAEAARIVLSTSYYDYSLIDLISAYLSRENSAELQLNSAKCLTNLCRSLLKLSSSSNNKYSNKTASLGSTTYHNQIKSKPASTITSTSTITTRSKVTTLRRLNKIKLDEQLNQNEHQHLQTTADSDDLHSLNESKPSSGETNDCFTLKLIDYSSQLIRLRCLPTLVRLCCTYSALYRNSNSTSVIPTGQYFDLSRSATTNINSSNCTKLQLNQASYLNLFLLIQSVTTLTYLIELNSDLQSTAGCLEQIIPTLAFNIIDAYALFDLNKLRLHAQQHTTQNENTIKMMNVLKRGNKLNEINFKKRRLFNSVEKIKKQQNKQHSSSSSSASSSSTSTPSSAVNSYLNEPPSLFDYSSLFSLFYLNYNQFALKGVQFKLNEHQYRQLTSFNSLNTVNNSSNNVDLRRVNKYLCMLNQTVHKRLASVCFHALAALAANNEEARRQISENSGLISRLIDSVNLIEGVPNTNESDIKKGINDLNYLKLDDFLSGKHENEMQSEEDDENEYIDEDSANIENQNEQDEENEFQDDEQEMNEEAELIDELEEDFDDLNQTDADLLRLSGLCLLHSLSRSVHQLRTKFLDKKIWLPILDLIKRGRQRRLEKKLILKRRKRLIHTANESSTMNAKKRMSSEIIDNIIDEDSTPTTTQQECSVVYSNEEENSEPPVGVQVSVSEQQLDVDELSSCDGSLNEQNLISITTAILANLLLDFSPSKETMIENGIIKILVELIDHKNQSIRVNCMWSLMNLAFQADQKTKQLILSTITMEKIFQLLTEHDETLVLKTLGLIRNLISSRTHIDLIMTTSGTQIIQAIIMILESDYYNVNVKEQALCILSNVADGQSSKEFIMDNEDLLRKINSFMTHNSLELQLAAVYCVSNLVNANDDGAIERQSKLKEMGVQKILQKLLQSIDPVLFEKVKVTLQQFSSNSLQSLSSSSSSSSTSSLINSGSASNLH